MKDKSHRGHESPGKTEELSQMERNYGDTVIKWKCNPALDLELHNDIGGELVKFE